MVSGQVRKTVEREVRVLRAVAHVNIVALLDVFRVAGRTHLVFEYVERTVLEALKVHPKGLGSLATRRIMWQLVKAVEYLHSLKVGRQHHPERSGQHDVRMCLRMHPTRCSQSME